LIVLLGLVAKISFGKAEVRDTLRPVIEQYGRIGKLGTDFSRTLIPGEHPTGLFLTHLRPC